MSDEIKAAVMEFVKTKTERGKGLSAMRDITKKLKEFDKREVRKTVQDLIADGELAYWSSGSTTYIRLADYEPGEEGLTDEH